MPLLSTTVIPECSLKKTNLDTDSVRWLAEGTEGQGYGPLSRQIREQASLTHPLSGTTLGPQRDISLAGKEFLNLTNFIFVEGKTSNSRYIHFPEEETEAQ